MEDNLILAGKKTCTLNKTKYLGIK
ncbi:uncharacterized protein G2W53_010088 [Senna tora]|uniref:Uncharacterized protein n=1 Tax=Senna tora TaxID=362788 RepID=A0A835C974_9FABA|nr:uncharacterized protein G2W53_010088 [Senna tora]